MSPSPKTIKDLRLKEKQLKFSGVLIDEEKALISQNAIVCKFVWGKLSRAWQHQLHMKRQAKDTVFVCIFVGKVKWLM